MLETLGLSVQYGNVVALADVDLSVDVGECVGLIGPNGAGKTTLIDTLSGFITPRKGSVRFRDRDVTALRPHQRSRLGLARTFQSNEALDLLTVRANVLTAAERHVRRSRWRIGDTAAAQVDDILHLFDLVDAADHFPTDLSYGHQKLVGLAAALATSPSIVLLDEPAAGLDAAEVDVLARAISTIRERDAGVLLVDHDMDVVFSQCDRVYVLDYGRILCFGTPDIVRNDPRVREAYLGAPVERSST